MLGPALVGFAVAVLITGLELVQLKFPKTWVFAVKSWALYVYCLIYGLIAFFVLWGFDSLRSNGVIKVEGLGASNPWILALYVGISVKALLHIRLYTVGSGTPIGPETIVHLFEPGLIDSVEQRHFVDRTLYVATIVNRCTAMTQEQIKQKLTANIRSTLPAPEKGALELDIQKAKTPDEAITVYLNRFGKHSVEVLFPKPPN